MTKTGTYYFLAEPYEVLFVYKRIRNINISADFDKKTIRVSAPIGAFSRQVEKAMNNAIPKLYKRYQKISHEMSHDAGWTFLLGVKTGIALTEEKDFAVFYKMLAQPIFESRVRHYESLMGVTPPYKVKARSMKSRYGVNSKKSHTLTFQSDLICFPIEVIDAIVVHELAHHFVFDHSEKFYKIVYAYCPKYKTIHDNLRKRKYGKNH